MATTREKVDALIGEVISMKPGDADESTRGLIELLQIGQGFGLDVHRMIQQLMPQSDAEADQMVDALIALLYQARGDDLPPFDLDRHTLDATAMDTDA